jgi:hypothetical protein
MKLTNISRILLSFFSNNECIKYNNSNKNTNKVIKNLYKEIKDADNYLQLQKEKQGELFYNLKIKEIQNYKEIPKPKTFASSGFPIKIRNYIDENIIFELEYNIYLLDRFIKIYFLFEDFIKDIHIYNNYIDNILIWIIILNDYASKSCAPQLTIYIYLTYLQKEIPLSNITVLNEFHANTAFTMTCPKNSEIVIYRKEEWFKVLLHETFHNFGLDFSDMNNEKCNLEILNIFPVNSQVNLYESYAEFWAKIMNILLYSYFHIRNKNNIEEFLEMYKKLINLEIIYNGFQMIKVLDFMNLKYNMLYEKGVNNEIARKNLYKENTNINNLPPIILTDLYLTVQSLSTFNVKLTALNNPTSYKLDNSYNWISKKYNIRICRNERRTKIFL